MSVNASCVMDKDVLKVSLFGNIDSTNAPEIMNIVMAAMEQKPCSAIVDAAGLQYISSAGLRILLAMKKKIPDISLVEVSNDVYEILEMTGFTELMSVTKAFRVLGVEGCRVLGEGRNGIVYRLDPETVVKVYKKADALDEIHHERELARKAFVMGLPTAIPFDVVRVGQCYGSVFELLNARSLTECIIEEPERIDHYIAMYVEVLKLIHQTEDIKKELPDKKADALGWKSSLGEYVDEALLDKFMNLIAALPERYTLLHGDYHINNVEVQNGEAMLIDMDTLSHGHPIFDLAGMFASYIGYPSLYPDNAMDFFGLPDETCTYIWLQATRLYAGSEEAAQEIREKAGVVCYAQLARWIIRHEDVTASDIQTKLHFCLHRFAEGIEGLSTLDFTV